MSCEELATKIRIKTSVFVILLLVTLACIGLIVGCSVIMTRQDLQNAAQKFVFVTLVIACCILGLLLVILIYVWIADYLMK